MATCRQWGTKLDPRVKLNRTGWNSQHWLVILSPTITEIFTANGASLPSEQSLALDSGCRREGTLRHMPRRPRVFSTWHSGVKRCTTLWTICGKKFSVVNCTEGYLWPKTLWKNTSFSWCEKQPNFATLTRSFHKAFQGCVESIPVDRPSIALSNETSPGSNGWRIAEKTRHLSTTWKEFFFERWKTGDYSAIAVSSLRNVQKGWYFGYEIFTLEASNPYRTDPILLTIGGWFWVVLTRTRS